MSQYGARGRAKAGESAARILAAYYRSARPATTDPAQVVRVLLLDREPATTASPLVIHGRGGSWTIDGLDRHLPGRRRAARLAARRSCSRTRREPGPQLEVLAPDGTTPLFAGAFSTTVVVRPAEPGDAPPARRPARGARHVSRGAQGRPRPGRRPASSTASASTTTCGACCRWRCRRAGPARRCGPRPIAARSYAVRRLHPGYGRLRPLRRHPLAGLPRRRGRDRSDQRDHRRRARARSSSRAGTTGRSTPSSTRPAAARPRTTSTRSSGRRAR